MPSPVTRLERDLAALHRLAAKLFFLLRDEYEPLTRVTIHLEDCDAFAANPDCHDAVVRTLVNAQMLRYATQTPATANPRYVVGLGLFVDELIPSLLEEQSQTSLETAQKLHEIRGQIDEICMGLAVMAAPGMPDFTDK